MWFKGDLVGCGYGEGMIDSWYNNILLWVGGLAFFGIEISENLAFVKFYKILYWWELSVI